MFQRVTGVQCDIPSVRDLRVIKMRVTNFGKEVEVPLRWLFQSRRFVRFCREFNPGSVII